MASGTRDCKEVSGFLDKLLMVLAVLKELVALEPDLWGLDERELYGGLVGKLMRARFGEPDVEEFHDPPEEVAYRVGYRCAGKKGEETLGLEVLRPVEDNPWAIWDANFRIFKTRGPGKRGGGE
jgi:hypothetical protein